MPLLLLRTNFTKMKNTELTKKIKELRNKKAFSQDELAEASQLNLRTIQRIESGETEPRGHTLQKIAAALGVTPDELIDWTEETDKTYLLTLNLSALSFLAFPLLGVIIPLILWTYKKDKIKDVNETGKKLLNFQISWCIILFLTYLLLILTALFKIDLHLPVPGIISAEMMILLVIVFYGINIILVILNSVFIYLNKKVYYQPSLRFLK